MFISCCLASCSCDIPAHEITQKDINYERWSLWHFFSSLSSLELQLFFFSFFYGESSFFVPPPPHLHPCSRRGQGWFPVILAGSVNACCSISRSIKLFLSCSAATESTAHNCRLRGLAINHADLVSLHARTCVHVCMFVCVCVWVCEGATHLFLRLIVGCEEHSFCPLDPGNANGPSKRSAVKWGIEEPFHSPSSLSTYISPPHFPFHEKTCLWMLVISI